MVFAFGIDRAGPRALLLGLMAATLGQVAHAAPPGCTVGDCGLRTASAYEYLVIARVGRIATDEEMRRLYGWAKPRIWRDFQDDEADYLRRNRLFVLPADRAGAPVMVHMSHEEFRRVGFEPGDLVRYIPHVRGAHPGADESLYSDLAGCIAVLCRASDPACASQYRTGVFRRADGVELVFRTQQPKPGGVVVDPVSLLPQSKGAGAPSR